MAYKKVFGIDCRDNRCIADAINFGHRVQWQINVFIVTERSITVGQRHHFRLTETVKNLIFSISKWPRPKDLHFHFRFSANQFIDAQWIADFPRFDIWNVR